MVKCSDCGFLTVRNVTTRGLEEAGDDFREKASIPTIDPQGGRPHAQHEQRPLCFARCHNLGDEISKGIVAGTDEVRSVKQVIHNERECGEFVKWQQGFTPKEHREMIDRQSDRKWRIITGIIFIVLAGLFTLLGAYIAKLN